MITILIKQPVNFWRSLETRYKAEIILLGVLMFAFFATRMQTLLNGWLNDGASATGITLLTANLFSLQTSLTSIAVIAWILPRQRNLSLFLIQPLENRFTFQALCYYCLKYLSVYLILYIPVTTAIAYTLGLLYGFLGLSVIISNSLFFIFILFILKQKSKTITLFICYGFLIHLFYYATFSFFYWRTEFALLFQLTITALFSILTWRIYSNRKSLITIESFTSFGNEPYSRKIILKDFRFNFPKILPLKTQQLFEKEFFSLWRNVAYGRMKIYTLAGFLIICVFLIGYEFAHKEIWTVAITSIFIWFHYTNNFNEKYTFSEPDWFMKTLPIRFRQLLAAKLLSELPFAAILVIMAQLTLIFSGATFEMQLTSFLLILIFSFLILFIMLNFKIMFYNNTRLAGYAYHFSIIFFGIMIFNYPLVGPIITLFLLIYFVYKNISYFNS